MRTTDKVASQEITPEMIEAGACVVACYSGREDDPSETAIEVFKAMMHAMDVTNELETVPTRMNDRERAAARSLIYDQFGEDIVIVSVDTLMRREARRREIKELLKTHKALDEAQKP